MLPASGQNHLIGQTEECRNHRIEFTKDVFRSFSSFSGGGTKIYQHELALQNFKRVNLYKAHYVGEIINPDQSNNFVMNELASSLTSPTNSQNLVAGFNPGTVLSALATQHIDGNLLDNAQKKEQLANLITGMVIGLVSPTNQDAVPNPLLAKFTTNHMVAIPAHVSSALLDAATKLLSDSEENARLDPAVLLNKGIELGKSCQQESILAQTINSRETMQQETLILAITNVIMDNAEKQTKPIFVPFEAMQTDFLGGAAQEELKKVIVAINLSKLDVVDVPGGKAPVSNTPSTRAGTVVSRN